MTVNITCQVYHRRVGRCRSLLIDLPVAVCWLLRHHWCSGRRHQRHRCYDRRRQLFDGLAVGAHGGRRSVRLLLDSAFDRSVCLISHCNYLTALRSEPTGAAGLLDSYRSLSLTTALWSVPTGAAGSVS